MMSRTDAKGNDSGWFFGCVDTQHNHQALSNLRRVSLYEAAVRYNERIVPFLSLPANIFVDFREGIPSFLLGDREIPIKPKSYLDRKFQAGKA